ncbi:MAG: DNA gyrase subunit A [Gammaproteobacteria bacterium]|nr:DNA gyrase subunit A [Gammaproteobacteria bacterium]
MADFARELTHITLEEEMQRSYLDYAMSVIVGRALPDVRDGLKPVHRRVLYAMKQLGNDYNKPYKKSARVVGDVIGKYHPHGDSAVYDTIVRMAQPFSMRAVLVDGQGNFGSVDGDMPAAMRYTEVRMAKLAHEMLADIDKDTVDFQDNYDGSEKEPEVLPTRLPSLLVNGSSGIAVGMATNIPPHNLGETIRAAIALLDDPDTEVEGLMEHLPGPDFPTAGILSGRKGILDAYRTGRGRIFLRARSEIEENRSGHAVIVVTELPYQVNKARLIEKIAELVRDKRIEGIAAMRDESDKDGMRVVIELKRDGIPEVVLNNLYRHTQMQTVFGINMVALEDGRPQLLNLKRMLEAFLRHRRQVVTRRTVYELGQARRRAHVLEGLAVALANIDPVIGLIKAARSAQEAKDELIARDWEPGAVVGMLEASETALTRPVDVPPECGLHDGLYKLSPEQAQAILDMRLHRLTGLEQEKIVSEYKALLDTIRDLRDILADPDRLRTVIRDELDALRAEYDDPRRTEITALHTDLEDEDLIADEEVVVTLSHGGYIKYQLPDTYQSQHRGGRGKKATAIKDEDFVEQLFVAHTHDTLLCFSNRGKLYWIKVYRLPEAGRGSRGRPIVNLLPLGQGERITGVLSVREYDPECFVFMATRHGTVKKTALDAFSHPRSSGIIALGLKEEDELIGAVLTDGSQDMILAATSGRAIRFSENDVRAMGRTAAGVRGMRIKAGDGIIALLRAADGELLFASARGYGKRTDVNEFSRQGRGGQGVIGIKTSERNGAAVGALSVNADDDLMLISAAGTLVRIGADEVSRLGRNTQGVRLIRLDDGDRLVGIARLAENGNGEEGSAEESA